MNDPRRAALSAALQAPPAGGPPPMPAAGPGGPSMGAPMPPDQAMQFLGSMGITPDNLPMVAQAIESVMGAMGGAGAGGAGGPPPGPPQGGPPPGAM